MVRLFTPHFTLQYHIMLLGDRGKRVSTTCRRSHWTAHRLGLNPPSPIQYHNTTDTQKQREQKGKANTDFKKPTNTHPRRQFSANTCIVLNRERSSIFTGALFKDYNIYIYITIFTITMPKLTLKHKQCKVTRQFSSVCKFIVHHSIKLIIIIIIVC